jgi:hypothetical protein
VKLFVGGNALAGMLADYCAVMNPRLEVELVPWVAGELPAARKSGVVLWQIGAGRERPAKAAGNVVFWPDLSFRAFHPDQTYVASSEALVPSPVGHAHSMLAFTCWQRGMSVARTCRLFRADIFAQAGYFVDWESARAAFVERTSRCGADLAGAFARWERAGVFMHGASRPKGFAIADVAREALGRADIDVRVHDPAAYVADRLIDDDAWPIYPEIGHHLGVDGAYLFAGSPPAGSFVPPLHDLERFVAGSFAEYARYAPEALACRTPSPIDWQFLVNHASARLTPDSPQAGLPDERFWSRAVAGPAPRSVDPASGMTLPISRSTRVASIGSSFARYVGAVLLANGYRFMVGEPETAHDRVTSLRTGSIYTARALRQLFERAYGTRVPDDVAWQRADGRYIDPYRPSVEPLGFENPAAVVAAWSAHYAAARALFEGLDVLIVTLGHTEEWYARTDGSVFPPAPGEIGHAYDPSRYGLRNARYTDVVRDLDAFLASLRSVNRSARVVLTISANAPRLTYEPRHIQISATTSKAVLRAAADAVERVHPNVSYFPLYEIATGAQTRGSFFDSDLRTINERGMAHLMQVFFAHCAPEVRTPMPAVPAARATSEL